MFKPGDVVVITEPDDWDTGPSFVKEMGRWCGRKVVIESVVGYDDEHDCDGGWYTLVGGEFYYFAGNWMKKANKFKGNK